MKKAIKSKTIKLDFKPRQIKFFECELDIKCKLNDYNNLSF